MTPCERAGSMRVQEWECAHLCASVCVPVAPLAPAGLENHPRGTGHSHACKLGNFPSLWPQSLDPPCRLCRGLGLGRGAPGHGQEGLGGPWSRQRRPGRSSGPSERWARLGSAGSALGADGRVGLPNGQPQGRPRKAPGLRPHKREGQHVPAAWPCQPSASEPEGRQEGVPILSGLPGPASPAPVSGQVPPGPSGHSRLWPPLPEPSGNVLIRGGAGPGERTAAWALRVRKPFPGQDLHTLDAEVIGVHLLRGVRPAPSVRGAGVSVQKAKMSEKQSWVMHPNASTPPETKTVSRCGLWPAPVDCGPPGPAVRGTLQASTGVGCHALLQGIFPTQRSNLGLLHGRQILYRLSHQGSPLPPNHQPKNCLRCRVSPSALPSTQPPSSRPRLIHHLSIRRPPLGRLGAGGPHRLQDMGQTKPWPQRGPWVHVPQAGFQWELWTVPRRMPTVPAQLDRGRAHPLIPGAVQKAAVFGAGPTEEPGIQKTQTPRRPSGEGFWRHHLGWGL